VGWIDSIDVAAGVVRDLSLDCRHGGLLRRGRLALWSEIRRARRKRKHVVGERCVCGTLGFVESIEGGIERIFVLRHATVLRGRGLFVHVFTRRASCEEGLYSESDRERACSSNKEPDDVGWVHAVRSGRAKAVVVR
jgi:hypothetical protein